MLYILPVLASFSFFWSSYFRLRKGVAAKLIDKKSQVKLKVRTLAKLLPMELILSLNLPIYISSGLYWGLLRGYEGVYFSKHLCLSDISINYFNLLFIFGLIIIIWIRALYNALQLTESALDYLFILLHLFFYLPFIVLANTLLTLLFILELTSSLLLVSFTSLQNLSRKVALKDNKPETQFFFNLIFFQFWSSFFSSLLILYSLMSLYFLFGTTEWFYLNLLISHQAHLGANWLILLISLISLILGLFIKLGVGPFFAYKLEIYQGLPLYSLIFYSIVFFFFF